jgi:hypothetical protein
MKSENKKSNWIIMLIYIVGIVIALRTLLKTPLPAIIIGTILIVFSLILLIVKIIIPRQKKKKIEKGLAMFFIFIIFGLIIITVLFCLSLIDLDFDPYSGCSSYHHNCDFYGANIPNVTCNFNEDCIFEYGKGTCDLNRNKCWRDYVDGSKKACTDAGGEWTRYARSCWID